LSRRSVTYEFIHPAELIAWTKTSPPHIRAHVREISFQASYAWCAERRGNLLFDRNLENVYELDELVEACELLQDLECVELALWSRPNPRDTKLTAAIENLGAEVIKKDGRKVEVVLRCGR
jgi:hypothetical protein